MTGQELQRIRESLGLSRKEFADLCGYDGDAQQLFKLIKRYEDGSRGVPPLLSRLAYMMDLHADTNAPRAPIEFPDNIDEDGEDPSAGRAASAIGGR